MQKNKALKGLLAISAAAAMFATFGVQAQVTAQNPSTQKMTDANPSTQVGKTNTAMPNHAAHGQSGAGMSGSTGTGATGMSDTHGRPVGHERRHGRRRHENEQDG